MGWSKNNPNGLIHYTPQQAYRGYTLVTNLNGQESRLIDMEGRICHTWHSSQGIGYSYLLPNGNLLLRTGPAAEETSFLERPEMELLPRGGRTVAGAILELDWDSNVVWEYRYPPAAPRLRTSAQRQHPRADVGTDPRGNLAAGQGRAR